jgi:tripartite-type tricarboxylate transporter receptor subunit TctC
MRRFFATLLVAAFIIAGSAAHAQDWPQAGRAIRIFVPIPPGGTADGLARAIANKLSQNVGVPAVVENKVGASTMVAAQEIRKAPPDGHTILYTITTTTSQLPHFYRDKPPFDIFTDFTPLGLIAYNSLILVATPKAPFGTVQELVAYARANPGKLNFGSFGNGSNPHIDGEFMKKQTGIQMTHVPYRGSADASRAVMSGELDILFDAPVTAINTIQAGSVKGLAIAGRKRIPEIAQVPTMVEAGMPGFDTPGLEQLLGPPGMSRELTAKVNAALMTAVRSPEVAELYRRGGFELVASTSDEHTVLMRENSERWGKIIRDLKMTLD